jgi:hypothetical protein
LLMVTASSFDTKIVNSLRVLPTIFISQFPLHHHNGQHG